MKGTEKYWNTGKRRNWTPAQARYIFNRDGGICIFCGRPATEIHHVLAYENGGKSVTSNGVCICHACNMLAYKNKGDISIYTRAIFWLEQHGEDTSWIDSLWESGDKIVGDIPDY